MKPTSNIRSSDCPRPGLTLIELLAVIAIVGLLVALLLPAVQGAREAGRRLSCGNNIRQLALAVEGHHATNAAFPPGATVSDGSCEALIGTRRGAPWPVFILPYLDQGALFDRLQPNLPSSEFAALQGDSPPEPSIDAAAQNTPLTVFKCPSDSAHRPSDPSSNYVGVQGGGAEAEADCRTGTALNYRLRFSTGILFTNSRVTAGSIRDGLSNTFLVGESRWWSYQHTNVGWPNWFAWSSANRTSSTASHTIMLAAATDPINGPLIDYDASRPWADTGGGFPNALYLGTHTRAFGSRHPGGCNMAFADGSVQFVAQTIAIDIYRQLANRRDGRPTGGYVP